MNSIVVERLDQAITLITEPSHWFQGPGHARDAAGNSVACTSRRAQRWNVPGAAAKASFLADLFYLDALDIEKTIFHYIMLAAHELELRLDDLEDKTNITPQAAHQRDLDILRRARELATIDLRIQ